MSSWDDEIAPGDIVAVRHGLFSQTEGLVVGSRIDNRGYKIIEVRLDSGTHGFQYPQVTRVRRTIYSSLRKPNKVTTVERRILW